MYCPSCGEEISASSAYCQHCGAALSEAGDDVRDAGADEWGTTRSADRGPDVEPAGYGSGPSTDAETLAALGHVLALFTWAIGPAVLLLSTDDEFVRENATNAINWQLSFAIYMLVSLVLTLVIVGIFAAILVGLLDTVFCIVAAVKAADGETWEYPLTIDFF
ncbi:zinc ribbon domain-containing protein [Halosolutus halophilus]|uniref:zinc ribbon domain-containing protein n=1 Tax=Halosolutus halophilus TaxID=1552990 RepID=UPI0022351885|nr:zinc ribbon domain-containing protein [Halosolutus halophilus]